MKKIIFSLCAVAVCAFANEEQSLEQYEKACDGGDLEACIKAGDLNLEVNANNDALKLFEKACDGGDLNGCAKAGGVYSDWYGMYFESDSYKKTLPTWKEKGTKLYEKACKGGIKEACNVEFGAY